MTGKICDTTTFYKMGSLLKTKPLDIDFITHLMSEVPGTNTLIPLDVNEILEGRIYSEIYYEFLNDSELKLM
jgi:hypothetical protein